MSENVAGDCVAATFGIFFEHSRSKKSLMVPGGIMLIDEVRTYFVNHPTGLGPKVDNFHLLFPCPWIFMQYPWISMHALAHLIAQPM